jgi:hypothetical protein
LTQACVDQKSQNERKIALLCKIADLLHPALLFDREIVLDQVRDSSPFAVSKESATAVAASVTNARCNDGS